jgi:putative phage-type endonuclease
MNVLPAEEFTLFSVETALEIIKSAFSLINDYVADQPMAIINPSFHDELVVNVTDLLVIQFSTFNNQYDEHIEELIEMYVEEAMRDFYTFVSPKRSQHSNAIHYSNADIIEFKLQYINSIPFQDQRSDEWHEIRHGFLTASNIWKAFGSESSRNQLIFEKCSPFNKEKYSGTNTDSPMHWGQKYECLSKRLYELEYSTEVTEFGCIPHKSIKYIAASPDGINTLGLSPRYGRMIEIKNIVNRDIDGTPKSEYWIQMQLQMEVCDLDECDFIETRFKEYQSETDFLLDSIPDEESLIETDFGLTEDGRKKGVIMQFLSLGQIKYEYAPFGLTKPKLLQWEEVTMKKYKDDLWVKNIYWHLDEFSCVLVMRNKLWFSRAEKIINDIWDIITYEKINGYAHRAPKKKKMTNKNISMYSEMSGCMIDLESLKMSDDIDDEF